MKLRQVLILAIIFVILVFAVVYQQSREPAELSTEEYAPLDLSFDPSLVCKMEIIKGKDELLVELEKKDIRWTVVNYFGARGDQSKLNSLLKEIREAKGELRAKDKGLFKDFGLAEDEAIYIKLLDVKGQSLLDLLIGVKKPSYETLFLRKLGSDKIYLAKAMLFSRLGVYGDPATEKPKTDYWCANSLAELRADDIEKIETRRLRNGEESVTASILREVDPADPAKKKWKFIRSGMPFGIDTEKIKQFLENIPDWRATKVHDPKEKDFGFSKPSWQMELTEAGKQVLFTASQKDASSNTYLIQVSTEPVVFELGEWNFKNFDIDDSKFFVSNPLNVDPDKMEKLVIHTPDKELMYAPKQKKWESLTSYLNELKNIGISKLLFDSGEQKKAAGGKHWLEIQKEGEAPQILEVGGIISEQDRLYAARKRDNTQPVAISESDFKKLFENLDRLAEPKTT